MKLYVIGVLEKIEAEHPRVCVFVPFEQYAFFLKGASTCFCQYFGSWGVKKEGGTF
jgi:hypothetical protein